MSHGSTESRREEAHTNLKSRKSSRIPSARTTIVTTSAVSTDVFSRGAGSCPANSTAQDQASAETKSRDLTGLWGEKQLPSSPTAGSVLWKS